MWVITTVFTVLPPWVCLCSRRTTGKTLCAVLRRLAESGYGVIYITESKAALVQDVIEEYRERRLPAVILIPGVSGNTGAGIAQVKKSVEQAVGSDIIFTD